MNIFDSLTLEQKEKLLNEHIEHLKNINGKNFGEIEHPKKLSFFRKIKDGFYYIMNRLKNKF